MEMIEVFRKACEWQEKILDHRQKLYVQTVDYILNGIDFSDSDARDRITLEDDEMIAIRIDNNESDDVTRKNGVFIRLYRKDGIAKIGRYWPSIKLDDEWFCFSGDDKRETIRNLYDYVYCNIILNYSQNRIRESLEELQNIS